MINDSRLSCLAGRYHLQLKINEFWRFLSV